MTLLVAQWEAMDGFAVAHNMPDLRTLDLGRLANYVYWRTTDGADEKALDKFRARLWQPPRGVIPDKRSPWSAENEVSSFAAARASLGLVDTSAPSKTSGRKLGSTTSR